MTETALLEDASLFGADRHAPLSERSLSKLRWRCRRGLLENDRMALLSASFMVGFL